MGIEKTCILFTENRKRLRYYYDNKSMGGN